MNEMRIQLTSEVLSCLLDYNAYVEQKGDEIRIKIRAQEGLAEEIFKELEHEKILQENTK